MSSTWHFGSYYHATENELNLLVHTSSLSIGQIECAFIKVGINQQTMLIPTYAGTIIPSTLHHTVHAILNGEKSRFRLLQLSQ
jgi:hypothetical protein